MKIKSWFTIRFKHILYYFLAFKFAAAAVYLIFICTLHCSFGLHSSRLFLHSRRYISRIPCTSKKRNPFPSPRECVVPHWAKRWSQVALIQFSGLKESHNFSILRIFEVLWFSLLFISFTSVCSSSRAFRAFQKHLILQYFSILFI